MEGGNASAVVTALTAAANNIATEATNIVTSVAPIALGVLALSITLFFGIRMIKRVMGK